MGLICCEQFAIMSTTNSRLKNPQFAQVFLQYNESSIWLSMQPYVLLHSGHSSNSSAQFWKFIRNVIKKYFPYISLKEFNGNFWLSYLPHFTRIGAGHRHEPESWMPVVCATLGKLFCPEVMKPFA